MVGSFLLKKFLLFDAVQFAVLDWKKILYKRIYQRVGADKRSSRLRITSAPLRNVLRGATLRILHTSVTKYGSVAVPREAPIQSGRSVEMSASEAESEDVSEKHLHA